ncbi:sugar transferase [Pseudobutyrivibrio sp.]|uniref:sugar transferase n=1 Tax=Pseudobutyrivibrio sp. TaxID=2014367 RepID=UPI001DF2C2AC|nr:sugar transferase [Pseudobutyrivibrio sp.]MBE5911396.1 sugar transferase [Pseudobutyrivibrio sp.]
MYRKKKRSWVKHLDFIILDMIAAELALFVGVYLKFDGSIIFLDRFEWYNLYQGLAKILPFIDLTGVLFTETYTGILRRTKYQEITSTIWHCLVNFLGIFIYMYANKTSYYYSREAIGYSAVGMVVFTYLFRVIWKRFIRRRKLLDVNKSSMIVVAESTTVDHCLSEIAHSPYTEFKVEGVAVVDVDMTGQEIQGIPVIASADTLFEYLRTNVVDEVFLDGNTRASEESLAGRLVEQGLTVHMSLIHTNNLMPNRIMETYGDYVVLTTSMHIANNRQAFLKRLMDIVGALVGLVFAFIAFIIFAPIIKIQSPGPVFFTQTRIGKNGRRFKFYKFRTMYMDAEERKKELMAQNEIQGNMFKMENDPRIIPIGHFLRKYSIDELPQFWNVLMGQMSLVGTRPPLEDEYERYALHHKARLSIKPGLTGMWQVSGRSDIKDFEKVVALDTEYISNWSLGLDIKLLFKTIAVVFGGKGSK